MGGLGEMSGRIISKEDALEDGRFYGGSVGQILIRVLGGGEGYGQGEKADVGFQVEVLAVLLDLRHDVF